MSIEYDFLKIDKHTFPYRIYEGGEQLLIAFHGFGRNAGDFQQLAETLKDTYTTIALDFFYHGPHAIDLNTVIQPINTSMLAGALEKLMWKMKKVKCSLLGYSLGGRLVLGCIHRMPNRINHVFLLAPDGLSTSISQKMIHKTDIGRTVAYHLVKHPAAGIRLTEFVHKMGLMHEKKKEFMLSHFQSETSRLLAFRTWTALEGFNIHRNLVVTYLNKRPITIDFIFGKHDKIIPINKAAYYQKRLRKKAAFHELDCGHQLLQLTDEISTIIRNRLK